MQNATLKFLEISSIEELLWTKRFVVVFLQLSASSQINLISFYLRRKVHNNLNSTMPDMQQMLNEEVSGILRWISI